MKPTAHTPARRTPWTWIPTLYFAQGLPYVAVMTISVIMYKRLGLSNTDIALYTGWLGLPWVIKPFWSPFVDILRTKRWWTLTMQAVMAVGLACIAFSLPTPFYVQFTLATFLLTGFASATHDIAADGFYMLALDERDQSFYVGIRSTFYRIAMVVGQGPLVILAGVLETTTGDIPLAWSAVFVVLAAFFLLVVIYHHWALPRPRVDADRRHIDARGIVRGFAEAFRTFFTKRPWGETVAAIAFMLLYRFPEAQLTKIIQPFLLDPAEKGGLGLSTAQVGLAYGTVGVIGLTLGGIIGGMAAARGGLRRWLIPMAWSMSLTCLTFVYLSYAPAPSLLTVNLCVFVEQFGYGFGFTAYMLFLIHFSEGPYQTSHYAICTGFMALSMMLGMMAGWLQEAVGYRLFFLWTVLCCVTTIGTALWVKSASGAGKEEKRESDGK